ncbi:methyltransferase type 11 [Nannochloropsis gaditana]|uniref:Methyltransferase type 11 n=1 Tax=Nannochloropsis gaditana TaxID=72520 RepID=W7TB96_9STRA|nr:methyltransferase type 11 [Nannochloropsis gaditana]
MLSDTKETGGSTVENNSQVKAHYDALLGRTYTWMMGGASTNFEENRKFFDLHGLRPPTVDAKALDLGCGSGFQAIPLLELGYAVIAIDMSADLLQELKGHKEALARKVSGQSPLPSLTLIEGDILRLRALLPSDALASVDLAVCMGDTLTHLQSTAQVQSLVKNAVSFLKPGGTLILHFRDLTRHLEGTDRFLPCRTDENNIFTCVLEYEEAQETFLDGRDKEDRFVLINDLLYTRPDASAPWTFKKSQYKKLEVPPEEVLKMMQDAGMDTSFHPLAFGVVAVMGRKKP